MMRDHFKHIAILCIVLLAPSILAAGQQVRPGTWAKPVRSEHLRNFYQLDDKVYRSAQPDKKGFRELERLGIRNVLSFRDHHSDDDADGTKLKLFRIKMEAGEIRDDQVIEALRIIKNAEGPILIHCWHGSDRTGLVSAMYRIVFQGWSKDDAIDELIHGGYGYHSLYKNIPEYIRKVDVEKIKQGVFSPLKVIPAKAGIQGFHIALDPRFHGDDKNSRKVFFNAIPLCRRTVTVWDRYAKKA